ncbi:MAG TPA: helix-turn-helix transcriptional regulator [Beijerinckiaceae bacterium]|nr:helix-turn-helix transcriptional regulator [Beijerinckiaceae bacterium]
MTIAFKELRDRWMADPAFRAAYDKVSPEMEIAFAIAEARHRARLTQAQLAEKVGTSQATVARWESGGHMPSTKTLARIAAATGTRLRVELVAAT